MLIQQFECHDNMQIFCFFKFADLQNRQMTLLSIVDQSDETTQILQQEQRVQVDITLDCSNGYFTLSKQFKPI